MSGEHICIVCQQSGAQGRCSGCHRPLHQECGTQEQEGGRMLSCPDCTEQVAQAQQAWDEQYTQHVLGGA